MRGFVRAGVIVLIAISAAGCAASGYSSSAVERHLESIGVSPSAAKCVADQMPPTIGDQRLGARANPSSAEVKAERVLLRKCGVKAG